MEQIRVIQAKDESLADYTVILLIIASTGFEWCFRSIETFFFLVGPLSLFLFYRRRPNINVLSFLVLISIILWILGQLIVGTSTLSSLINFFIRLLIYYLVAVSVKNLPKVIVTIIYWICIISLIMYVICLIPIARSIIRQLFSTISPLAGFTGEEYRSNPGQSLIFYFLPDKFGENNFRNSGPFWEPGMFSIFINIALLIDILFNRKLSSRSFVLILASVTTLSTTSYIATSLILFFYFVYIKPSLKNVLYILSLAVCILIFINSDFGINKIRSDMANENTYSRFGAIAYHLKMIELYPITGSGFDSHNSLRMLVSPNGLSLIFVFWGIPAGIGYFVLLFLGIKRLTLDIISLNILRNSVFFYFIILLVVFSQDATMRHFYYILAFYSCKMGINNNNTKQIL